MKKKTNTIKNVAGFLLVALLEIGNSIVFSQWCTPTVAPYGPGTPGISNVTFNTINKTSPTLESSSSNYVNTGLSTTVAQGSTYNFSMTFNADASISVDMNLRVWIDFNQDGELDDPGETTLSADHQLPGTYTATITIPATATVGNTRMRVASKMTNNGGHTLPTPCNLPADPLGFHGGVEDYTIVISATNGVNNFNSPFISLSLSPNPADAFTIISYELATTSDIKAEVFNIMGQNVYTIANNHPQLPGNHKLTLNLHEAGLNEGIYFVTLYADKNQSTRKLIVLK